MTTESGCEAVESRRPRWASGRGIATIADRDGSALDVWFEQFGFGEAVQSPLGTPDPDPDRRVHFLPVQTTVDLDQPPANTVDGYLRLHLLSARHVVPNSVNLEGIFSVLPTVAWTNCGVVHVDDLPGHRARHRLAGRHLQVQSIDKFPPMADFVSPTGIRIADCGRVRLGAHLAEGTVVMHEGFVNFNAGTLGASMVEGRITQGSVVDEGADIGAGASIMGTLSGGGTNVSRIGKRALLGANAGSGISLGDDSAIEAGLYVTKGTVVTLPDGSTVKAIELNDQPGILFRRNSTTGTVEAVPWRSATFTGINPALHASP